MSHSTPTPPPRLEPRRWIFTFGPDHTLYVGFTGEHTVTGFGVSLRNRYVTITAPNEPAARASFVTLFGNRFAGIYQADDERTTAMIARHQMTELVLWP